MEGSSNAKVGATHEILSVREAVYSKLILIPEVVGERWSIFESDQPIRLLLNNLCESNSRIRSRDYYIRLIDYRYAYKSLKNEFHTCLKITVF